MGLLESLHFHCLQKEEMMEDDSFFDLLSRFQSRRIDDQRCSFRVGDGPTPNQIRRQSESVVNNHSNRIGESGHCLHYY